MEQPPRKCVFVSDLHGIPRRYDRLFEVIDRERPSAVFLGGDLFPHALDSDFLAQDFLPRFQQLKRSLDTEYPSIFLILGNDDPRAMETTLLQCEQDGLFFYLHGRKRALAECSIYGYACVPPTPFRLKDWERYDVSRYCDPGCISPEEGTRTVPVEEHFVKWRTIADDLANLTGSDTLDRAVFLFHSPPYDTVLDRAALDGRTFDHTPLDVHVGSIAIRRFIETRQPLLTLHGHVHESARLTGEWKTTIGRTVCLSAAHDGPELAVVRLDLAKPDDATRELL